MLQFQIEQLRRLPLHPEETWQGDLIRMPMWVTGEGPEPFRPWLALWVGVRDGKVALSQFCRPEQAGFELAWTGLLDFATKSDVGVYRPGRVEVRDPELAAYLETRLAEAGIDLVCKQELESLDGAMAHMIEHLFGGPEPPGLLQGRGVTLQGVQRFAEAARWYYEAAPWRHLSDEDLLHVESPAAPLGMRYVTVLGAGGQTMGLGFYDSPGDCWDIHRQMGHPLAWLMGREHGMWSLSFGDVTELPIADSELWETYRLPLAADRAYPRLEHYHIRTAQTRPDAATLAFVEGLLRALAATSERQIDSGRWTVDAQTAEEQVRYTLALPDVLDPPDFKALRDRGFEPDRRAMERLHAQAQRLLEERQPKTTEEANDLLNRELVGKPDPNRFPPRNDRERAQELCYQAFDAIGRRQLQLARQAMQVDPGCADAYVILAERTADLETAAKLYEQGVAAGERALGERCFEVDAGHFWGRLDTRPYMRARLGLARCLGAMGQGEGAIEHYRQLLRLNPNDNQGVRYLLLPQLVALGRDGDATRLIKTYENDFTATWAYCRALLAFRLGGDSLDARKELTKALQVNPHVVKYLLNEEQPLRGPCSYTPGGEEEAITCVEELGDAFEVTPGAMQWLENRGRSATLARRPASPKPKKRKRKSG